MIKIYYGQTFIEFKLSGNAIDSYTFDLEIGLNIDSSILRSDSSLRAENTVTFIRQSE
jgi:hypothetical protein